MSIQLNTNFNLRAAIPVDTRFVFNSKTEMNSVQKHDLYAGLLTYVVSENKFFVYNGTTFNELRVDNDYFLKPVATTNDLTSINSPKVGAVCMVKDINRFYVYTGNTGDTATVVGWKLVANSADEISYNNSNSGLIATDVQNAIDELKVDIKKSLKDAGVNKPVNNVGDLDDIKDPKPGDTVTVINEKKIYIFNGTDWVELKAGSDYFIDPVELKTDLPTGQKNGTICLVRSERTLYLYVEDATAEEQGVGGAVTGPAWISLKTKSADIGFDNSDTDI